MPQPDRSVLRALAAASRAKQRGCHHPSGLLQLTNETNKVFGHD
jgi:hypothetical protein